jgi:T5orf172 domain
MRSIYVIQSEPGPVKIGVATNIRARLSALRTSSHDPLHLEYSAIVLSDAVVLERHAHAALSGHRTTARGGAP